VALLADVPAPHSLTQTYLYERRGTQEQVFWNVRAVSILFLVVEPEKGKPMPKKDRILRLLLAIWRKGGGPFAARRNC